MKSLSVTLRKILAGVLLVSSGAGTLSLLAELVQRSAARAHLWSGDVLVWALFLALAAVAGARLFADRPGGVPLALLYFGCQVVAFAAAADARVWAVVGPYVLAVAGVDGVWVSVGVAADAADVPILQHATPWAGVNLVALAAFWFLWRRPWRASAGAPAASAAAETVPPVA